VPDSPEDYFENCFVEPLAILKGMEDGKGAVVGLATALFLFERYWSILSPEERAKSREEQIERDFGTTPEEAATFWDVFRNGLLHLASPKQVERGKGLPPYSMRPRRDRFLTFETVEEVRTLIVDPWLFCNRVLELWKNKLGEIDANKSAPIPKRYRVDTYYFTDSPDHIEHRIVEET
jgi:hypothetical protein